MVWVAGLAKVICDNWKDSDRPLNSEALYQSCLFHDAAKLIKFKTFEQDTEHWEEVRQTYIKKYGGMEHDATIAMCKVTGVSNAAIELLNAKHINPFVERARFIANSDNFELKILAYCDSRIAPKGITSLQGRYEELLSRDDSKAEDKESVKLFLETEKQIQARTCLNLASISQETLAEQKEYFLKYEI